MRCARPDRVWVLSITSQFPFMDRESVLPAAKLRLGPCLSDPQIVDLSTPILPPARARSSSLGQQGGRHPDRTVGDARDRYARPGRNRRLSHIEPERTLSSLLSVG